MIKLHGNDNSHALGWRDPQSQLIRFEVLSDIADLNGRSVLDAGCGHGDLAAYLKNIYPDCRYFGVEQIPELLDVAIEKYGGLEDTLFFEGNFMTSALPVTDFVLVSGSFNYNSSDPDFIYKAIKRLFDSCRIGLGFNLLSKIQQNGLLRTYDKEAIKAFCSTLSDTLVIKDKYSDEDFTIFLYH